MYSAQVSLISEQTDSSLMSKSYLCYCIVGYMQITKTCF